MRVPEHCRPTVVLELQELMQRLKNVAELANTLPAKDPYTTGIRQGLLTAVDIMEMRALEVGTATTVVSAKIPES